VRLDHRLQLAALRSHLVSDISSPAIQQTARVADSG
jgi:hypothetical protein